MTTLAHRYQHDAHVANWLSATFNLTVEYDGYRGFTCWEGDYDLDCPTGSSDTRFGAALEYTACYDGPMFDRLNAIELGG